MALVPDTFENKHAFKSLLETSQLVFVTLGLARFLSDSEISNLENNVITLSQIVHNHFKNRNITLKETILSLYCQGERKFYKYETNN